MKHLERYMDGSHSLQETVNAFLDYLSRELDAFLENDEVRSDEQSYHDAYCLFGDGSVYLVEIVKDTETGEWRCTATRNRKGT